MSLFQLSTVSFQDSPLSDPNYSSPTNVATYRFPEDIGSEDKGHYMLFNIYVQELSKLNVPSNVIRGAKNDLNRSRTNEGTVNAASALQALGQVSKDISNNTLFKNATDLVSQFKNFAISGLSSGAQNNINMGIDVVTEGTAGVIDSLAQQTSATFNNNVVRLKDNIAIYMPDTLAFSSQASYDTPSLSDDALTLASVGKSIVENYNATSKTSKTNAAAFVIAAIKDKFPILSSASFNAAFVGKFGVKNPMVEVIYSKPELRSFRFDYLFYPRSESEAIQVQNIIETFIYHQAPEIKDGTAGYFLVPPSVFDIEFYYRGKINDNIRKISTCVLRSIDVDYAPSGFHAFETENQNPSLGGTGMPFGIRLSLGFQETRYITKQYIKDEIAQVNSSRKNVAAETPQVVQAPINKKVKAPPESPKRARGTIGNAPFAETAGGAATGRIVPRVGPKNPGTPREPIVRPQSERPDDVSQTFFP